MTRIYDDQRLAGSLLQDRAGPRHFARCRETERFGCRGFEIEHQLVALILGLREKRECACDSGGARKVQHET